MHEQTRIVPHLTCRNADAAIEFYNKAFGAETAFVMPDPQGRIMHACLHLDGAPIYLVEEFAECGGTSPESLGGTPVTIHVHVADCDALFERAVANGCEATMPPQDRFWGDRYGMVKDPYGHRWSIATTKRLVSPEEMVRAGAQMAASA